MHTWFNELLCHGGIICPITFWDVGLIDFSLLRGGGNLSPPSTELWEPVKLVLMTKTIIRGNGYCDT